MRQNGQKVKFIQSEKSLSKTKTEKRSPPITTSHSPIRSDGTSNHALKNAMQETASLTNHQLATFNVLQSNATLIILLHQTTVEIEDYKDQSVLNKLDLIFQKTFSSTKASHLISQPLN